MNKTANLLLVTITAVVASFPVLSEGEEKTGNAIQTVHSMTSGVTHLIAQGVNNTSFEGDLDPEEKLYGWAVQFPFNDVCGVRALISAYESNPEGWTEAAFGLIDRCYLQIGSVRTDKSAVDHTSKAQFQEPKSAQCDIDNDSGCLPSKSSLVSDFRSMPSVLTNMVPLELNPARYSTFGTIRFRNESELYFPFFDKRAVKALASISSHQYSEISFSLRRIISMCLVADGQHNSALALLKSLHQADPNNPEIAIPFAQELILCSNDLASAHSIFRSVWERNHFPYARRMALATAMAMDDFDFAKPLVKDIIKDSRFPQQFQGDMASILWFCAMNPDYDLGRVCFYRLNMKLAEAKRNSVDMEYIDRMLGETILGKKCYHRYAPQVLPTEIQQVLEKVDPIVVTQFLIADDSFPMGGGGMLE